MPRGGYRIPTYVLADMAEREARQAELDKQYEEQCRGKVGIDPTVEYHPVLNPTQDEVEQREIPQGVYRTGEAEEAV